MGDRRLENVNKQGNKLYSISNKCLKVVPKKLNEWI